MSMKLREIRLKNNKSSNFKFKLFMMFTVIALFLSVGYSALNEDLSISSEAHFRIEKDIRITDLHLKETTNMGIEEYNSEYNVDSVKIGVGLPNLDSTVTYEVEVTNNGNVEMWIESITDEIKNNDNIEYTLDGISTKDLINTNTVKAFDMVFKYKSSVSSLPSNTKLDLKTLFKFNMPESVLAEGSNTAATSTFFNSGPITKQEVESVTFMPTIEVPESEEVKGYWDASQKKDGTVMAWYTDTDENHLYELYIGGAGKVYAPETSSYLFANFPKLTNINFGNYFDTSNVTVMNSVFYNCSKLNNLDISSFNTEKVIDMSHMFYNCSVLTNLDLSNFDTSKVTDMSYMFSHCEKIESINVANFNTTEVTDISHMFEHMKKIERITDLNFDTSNVTNMHGLFNTCEALKEVDISSFNTSKVTDMASMFFSDKNLVSITIGDDFNTSKVTDMHYLLYSNQRLTNLGTDSQTGLNFDKFDTSNVTNMQAMFEGLNYSNDTRISLDISNFVLKQGVNVAGLFRSCSKITDIDISSMDLSIVGDHDQMFYNNSINTTVYLKDEVSREFVISEFRKANGYNYTTNEDIYLDVDWMIDNNKFIIGKMNN